VSTNFQIGAWRVEPGLNSVSNNDTTAHLEPKVMEVLLCLAAQPGDPVSKEDLLRTVWPGTFVSDDVLTRSISELRRVFADDAKNSRFIQTIPKRGYRLIAPVISGNGDTEVGSLPASTAKLDDRISRQGRTHVWAFVASAIPLLGLLTWWQAAAIRNWFSVKESLPPIHSLAVLPLQNLSGDPQQEYFADAMTEELITELSRIRALNVISRTSVMAYKQSTKSLPEIARELHADAIVEGSIVRSGDRVRVTAQLIHAAKDNNIWAQTYDRDLQDVLTLQSAVATAIANEIQVRITPDVQSRLKSLRPVNPKALDTYFQARYHLAQANNLTYYSGKQPAQKEEYRKAILLLDQAIQEDPTYLPAYAAYFDAVGAPSLSQLEYLPRAKALLTKALELDDSNVDVHLALARLLMQFEYDWQGAEQQYRAALELAPNSGDVHSEYSEYLENVGRNSEGDKELELAQALNPTRDYLADAGVHRIGKTLEQDRQVLEERAPNDPFSLAALGKGYAVAGRYQESVEMWRRCLTLYGWNDAADVLRRADARGGPKFAMEEWMRAFEERENRLKDVPVVPMAFTYSSLGNNDRAFAWLDKAVEQRNWMIIYLKRDDVWNPLRSDPRFKVLLHRVGLPE
jgi:TolB-like protein/DNA-binding winged helix-turn-helix (wHTH) protein